MVDNAVYDYFRKMAEISDLRMKVEGMLRGCIHFFPFERAAFFTYSPLSHLGEGVMLLEKEKASSIKGIKEDVRPIFPIYQVLTRNKPAFIKTEESLNYFPDKYLNELDITLAIIPISLFNTVVGCVLVDRYQGEYPFEKNYLSLLSHYFSSPFMPAREKNLLSKRETEVLQHLANGYSIKEMASWMSVSEFTVRDYITSVVRKLGVNNRAEAVAVGMRNGIIL